jgi:hypothetical protein
MNGGRSLEDIHMAYAIDFAEIKAATTWEQVLQHLQITRLRKTSNNKLRGDCPLCKANDNEFSVTDNAGLDRRGLFHCFACKSRGDMLELVSRMRGHGPKDKKGCLDAAKELAELSGVPRKVQRQVNSSPSLPSEVGTLERIAQSLKRDAPELEQFDLSAETMEHFTAGYKGSGSLPGKFAIAIHDINGELVGFAGHTVKGESPELTFVKGFNAAEYIFNAHRVEPGELRVLSSPLAVLQAFEGGETNVVSFLTETVCVEQLTRFEALLDAKQCTWLP